jgi:hypothetical protein
MTRLPVLGYDLAVGDGVEVFDPGLLGGVVGVAGGLPGLHPLKGQALLAEQAAHALVADVVDHPLGDQEVGQLGQAPGRERQAVLGRLRLGDLLDLPAFREGERSGPAALVLWVQSVEAVGVEVVNHVPDPVWAGERHLGDLRHGQALRGQQHHLGPPPGHHRSGTPADDPQQAPPLVIIDLTDAYSFCHPDSLATPHRPNQHPNGASPHTGQRFSDAALARTLEPAPGPHEPRTRPSDYETDARRRTRRLQTDLACSRWMPRRSRRLQTAPEGSSG